MTRWLRRIYNWFRGPATAAFHAVGEPPGIDVDELVDELDLAAEAQKLGEAGLPREDETELSGAEARALQRIDKYRQNYLTWALNRLHVLNLDLARYQPAPLIHHARTAEERFTRAASALLAEHSHLLEDLRADAVSRQQDLAEFRARHQLSRAALVPGPAERLLRLGLLVFLIVVEGALNAFFFSQGLSSGLLGGFLYASAFAFLNVALAAVVGRVGIPWLNHRNLAFKLVGVFALLLALTNAIAIALVIAHFRDALSQDVEQAADAAIASLLAAPWSLHDVQSWLLAALSLLFSLVAVWDGYGLDDPYPGHGRRHRLGLRAEQDYHEEFDALFEQLTALKESALRELDNELADIRRTLGRLHEACEHKAALRSRLHLAMTDSANCLASLLKTFRDTNQLYRRSPRPLYFSTPVTLPELPLPELSVAEDRRKYAEQAVAAAELNSVAPALRAAIESAFTRERDRLIPLDAQFDVRTVNANDPGEKP